MKFSVLTSTRDNRPTTSDLDWPAFSSMFATPWGEFSDKKDRDARAPLWSPATYRGGRKHDNIEAIHALVLDIDGASTAEGHQGVGLSEWFRALHAASPFVALAHTSFSHEPNRAVQGPNGPEPSVCGRLVVLPSRPVLPHEWPAVRSAFVRAFGGISDQKTDDPTRCYFGPITRPGKGHEYLVWRSDGLAGWDVDAALRSPAPGPAGALLPPAPRVHHAGDPVPVELVKRLAKKLGGSMDPKLVRIGTLLNCGLAGYSLAAPGARDDTLFLLACELGKRFPNGDANGIAEHFRNALGAMAFEAPDCPTVEDFAEKISRVQQGVHQQDDEQEAAPVKVLAKHISMAFEEFGVARSAPYSPEELAWFEQEAGPLAQRWILQKGKSFFLFFAGEYRECTREDLANAAPQYLAVAASAGVDLTTINAEGKRVPKTHVQLVEDYGRVLSGVEFDLAGVRSRLDRGVLKLECARLRTVEAVCHPDVQEWLELLAGDQKEALLDWIATVTWVRNPVPALYLKGEPGVGKGMLVSGLAKLWQVGIATPLADAMATFNGKILDCPLVFGDEQIPESLPGKPDVDPLKSLISASEHVINRKFKDPVTARGALRIVLAANNLRLLKSTQTREDAQAIADRLIVIEPGPEAKRWLEARGGYAYTNRWVAGDAIAQHARWLELDRRERVKQGRRFLLPGSDVAGMMRILTGSGARWSACRWIVSFLENPKPHQAARPGQAPAAVLAYGRVWVSVPTLRACWDHYLPGDRVPSTEEITRACAELLEATERQSYMGQTYLAMRYDALAGWLEANEPSLNARALLGA